jgi:hypothetical protein
MAGNTDDMETPYPLFQLLVLLQLRKGAAERAVADDEWRFCSLEMCGVNLYRNVACRSRRGRRLKSKLSTAAAAADADDCVRSILREMTDKLKKQVVSKEKKGSNVEVGDRIARERGSGPFKCSCCNSIKMTTLQHVSFATPKPHLLRFVCDEEREGVGRGRSSRSDSAPQRS